MSLLAAQRHLVGDFANDRFRQLIGVLAGQLLDDNRAGGDGEEGLVVGATAAQRSGGRGGAGDPAARSGPEQFRAMLADQVGRATTDRAATGARRRSCVGRSTVAA